MLYGSSAAKGLIEPRSVVEVPMLVTVQELDEQETTACFSVFGSPEPPLVSLVYDLPVLSNFVRAKT